MSLDYYFNDTSHTRDHCAEMLSMNATTFSNQCKKAYGLEAYKARFPGRGVVDAETKLKMLELISKTELSFAEIGRMFDVSHTPVAKLARTVLSVPDLIAREHRVRTRVSQENNGINPGTYKQVKAPAWYTGYTNLYGWTREHLINWCEANNETQVPEGHVVHHIDHDHRNNVASNLQLMTLEAHTAHHKAGT